MAQAKRIFASPLARRMAQANGLELTAIAGSGPGGRIVKRDIASAGPRAPAKPSNQLTSRDLPLTQMRKVIAQRLTQSKQTIPHFYMGLDVDLGEVETVRHKLNNRARANYKLSLNDFVIKAVAEAMVANPAINAIWGGDKITQLPSVDIAVAVAIPGGLITPVIRQADSKPILALSNEMRELSARAKEGRLAPHEYQGGGFSISNLGMYGIRSFQAVINPPQAAILAVGMAEERPVVQDGKLTIAKMMTVNLSADHRVVDGAAGAEWLQAFKAAVESPLGLLV